MNFYFHPTNSERVNYWKPFLQVAADVRTHLKHPTYFREHGCPFLPDMWMGLQWRVQIFLSKQSICQQDTHCQKYFWTFREQRARKERNLWEFSLCQLQLSLSIISHCHNTNRPCSCTKSMQIFEQLSPAIETFSANLLKDGRAAHRWQNTQEAGLQRAAQVLFRRVWKAHCLTGHDNAVLTKHVSQQAPLPEPDNFNSWEIATTMYTQTNRAALYWNYLIYQKVWAQLLITLTVFPALSRHMCTGWRRGTSVVAEISVALHGNEP